MDIEKILPGAMMGLIAVVMIVGVAQAMTPRPQYACPICGTLFMTYDELYSHFVTEHPASPIDIIWES